MTITVWGLALVAHSQAASQLPIEESKLCAAAHVVVVGTVTEFGETYTDSVHGGGVFTRRRLIVEEVIHGSPPPVIPIELPGAILASSPAVAGTPSWDVGTRHLLVLRYLPESEEHPAIWFRILDRGIPAGVVLPPNEVLRSIWAEHCAEHRPDLDPVVGNPSGPFVQFLGSVDLKACNHY